MKHLIGLFSVCLLVLGMTSKAALAATHINKNHNSKNIEKFDATENDGTPEEIHSKADADQVQKPEEFLEDEFQMQKIRAPKRLKARLAEAGLDHDGAAEAEVSPDVVTLQKQQDALMKRLEMLETQKQEQRAANVIVIPAAPQAIIPATPVAPVEAAPVVAAAQPQAAPVVVAKKFDKVPDGKVAEIAVRLKYTNEILKRWGLAYDYRSTTVKEFKKILADLEAQDQVTASN